MWKEKKNRIENSFPNTVYAKLSWVIHHYAENNKINIKHGRRRTFFAPEAIQNKCVIFVLFFL